jgi:RNA polymerase sigma factor for flagellar operon FliA
MTPINEYKKSALSNAHSLVNTHISLVNRIAGYLKARVPNYVEFDDMFQIGMLGLLTAAESYDASTGVEFKDYAKKRIKGAILDEVRKMSTISRLAIKNTQEHSRAINELSNELGQAPTNNQIANRLDISLNEYENQRTHADRFKIEDIESEEGDAFDTKIGPSENPLKLLEDDQLRDLVTKRISELDDRKKLIMNLYYVEEMNLKEIGTVVGVKEARVSQILSEIVAVIKTEVSKALN